MPGGDRGRAQVQLLGQVAGDQVPGGTETVLVVEDLAAVRDYVAVALRAYGYRVIPAGTSDEALRICERNHEPIHMVLTDVVMPKLSGPELVKEIHASNPEIPCIFMSGFDAQEIAGKGVTDVCGYLRKPFTPETLVRRVRNTLEGHSHG